MNEEEKKTLKYFYNLRALIDERNMLYNEEIEEKYGKEKVRQITIILNLIEKLQKENGKLKNKLLDTLKGQKVIEEETTQYIKENYISVQKIIDKMEELDIEILECEYSDDDNKEYKKAVEKDKLLLLNQKRILQELIEEREEK